MSASGFGPGGEPSTSFAFTADMRKRSLRSPARRDYQKIKRAQSPFRNGLVGALLSRKCQHIEAITLTSLDMMGTLKSALKFGATMTKKPNVSLNN